MPTFRVAVISPDRRVHDDMAGALEGYPLAESLWALGDYPDGRQLAALRADSAGCVVLLDFSDPLRAKAVAAELDRSCPTTTTVAILPLSGAPDLLELMQLGVREVIRYPLVAVEIARTVSRAGKKLEHISDSSNTGGNVFSFVPAKPGCGATTLATHVASAAARLSHQRTLLADFDLRLGMTSFLFKLHGEYSMMDALVSSRNLDVTLWERMICRRGTLDVLGSAPAEFGREIQEGGAPEVLNFARGVYPAIVADLPGDMRMYELEILRNSTEIFLVCSPEIGALHLAKKKAEMLRSLDLANNLSVIMNRSESRASMPVADIEQILQAPVRFQVESADQEVREATQKGVAIEGQSPLALQIDNIAHRIVPGHAPPPETQLSKRRFLDFFSVTPVRDVAGRKR
jgi:pilus assembly protein CpaE